MTKANAFVVYAKMRQSELKAAGVVSGFKEAIDYVGSEWKTMTEEERQPFEEEAERINFKAKGIEKHVAKKSKVGPSSASETPKKMIRNHLQQPEVVKDMLECGDLLKLGYIIINCNYYCEDEENQFIPSEIGLCVFSMEKGIMDMYWTLVDPGNLRTTLKVRENAANFGVPLPPLDERFQDIEKISNHVLQFVKRYSWNEETGSNVFCLPNQMRVIQGCLDWLLKNVKPADDSNSEIQLLPLDALGYALYESPPKSLNQCYLSPGTNKHKMVKPKPPFIPKNPITNSAQFTRILEAPQRAFYTEIACPHHQRSTNGTFGMCALGIVNRQAMTMMEILAPHFCVNLKAGMHLPYDEKPADVARRNEFLINWGYHPEFLSSYEETESNVTGKTVPKPDGGFVVNKSGGQRIRIYQRGNNVTTTKNRSRCISLWGKASN